MRKRENKPHYKKYLPNHRDRVRLDAKSTAYLLNRYLARVHFTKYDDSGEKGKEKIIFEKSFYQVQWQNMAADAKSVFKNPLQLAPQIAYSLASLFFILQGKHWEGMYVAFGAAVTYNTTTSGSFDPTVVTFAHDVGSGTDRAIVGGIKTFANGSEAGTHSSFTYAAAGLTGIVNAVKNNNGTMLSLWAKANPASGSNNCVATGIVGYAVWAFAISFTGVNQTTPTSGGTSTTGNSNTPSVNVTSQTDAIVVDFMGFADGSLSSIGSGQTQRYSETSNPRGYASTEAGASSVTMDWTLDATRQWAIAALSVDPPATPVASSSPGRGVAYSGGGSFQF